MRGILLSLMLVTPVLAAAQPVTSDVPAQFRSGPVLPIPAEFTAILPRHMRAAATELHQGCMDYANAPTRSAQRAVEDRLNARVPNIRAGQPNAPWAGFLLSRRISGDLATAVLVITPAVRLDTAGGDYMGRNIADTYMQRGSHAFGALINASPSDPLTFEAQIMASAFETGECSYLVRFRRLSPMR